jgi:hypothetical protein
MYAIVTNVVAPARISVRQFVSSRLNSKYSSTRFRKEFISFRGYSKE